MLDVFSVDFVNKNDQLYNNQNEEIKFTAREFAKVIKSSEGYTGKDIRLITCKAGSNKNGLAQQLADIIGENFFPIM